MMPIVMRFLLGPEGGRTPREQGFRRDVTNLPRPWQIVAAGGAMSCGGRANILRWPPKDMKLLAFGAPLLDAKIQKKSQKCKKNEH